MINAAHLVAANPSSVEARANLEAFKAAWIRSLSGVTKAVDDVTNIVDFLAVTEAHILEDIKKCLLALQDRNAALLADSALMVQGRSNRIYDAILRNLTNYQEDIYTERVSKGVNDLRSTLMPQFEAQVASAVQKIGSKFTKYPTRPLVFTSLSFVFALFFHVPFCLNAFPGRRRRRNN